MSEENTEVQVDDVEALKASLKAANNEAAANRVKARDLQQELESLQESSKALRSDVIASRAEIAIVAAGVNPKVAKMLDFSKIDLGEDGKLVGVDEQMESLRTDFPELFDAKRRAPGVDAADKSTSKRVLSSAEKLLARKNS